MTTLDVPKLLHRAMLAGATVAAAVLVFLREKAPPSGTVAPASVLRYAALAFAVGIVVAVQVMRSRIPPRAPGVDASGWWRAALGPAVVTWAFAESLILMGAILYYLSADFMTVGMAALGLLLMLLAAPDRLAGE
jgi:hypothetical protein